MNLPAIIAGLFFFLWLFLPPFSLPWGPVSIRKADCVRLLPLAVVLLLAPRRLIVRWHWIDLPVILFCLCPLICGLANGLGWQNSGWETIKEFGYWFVPYWLGRALFVGAENQRQLAFALLIAAACYVPPTVFEIINGPKLTAWMTGNPMARQVRGADRGWTYKPSVFLASGFVLTMFYVLATLTSIGLAWESRGRKSAVIVLRWTGAVFATLVVACQSLGSIALLAAGAVVMFVSRRTRTCGWLIPLVMIAPSYIGLRVSGLLTTDQVRTMAEQTVSADRAGSLVYRLRAEDLVFERMEGHWWLGLGDWGSWHQGANRLVLDGFWLFALTRTGLVSVGAWLAMVTIPIVVFACTSTRDDDRAPWLGLGLAVFLALSLIDSMFNYFGAASQMLVLGAFTGDVLSRRQPTTKLPAGHGYLHKFLAPLAPKHWRA